MRLIALLLQGSFLVGREALLVFAKYGDCKTRLIVLLDSWLGSCLIGEKIPCVCAGQGDRKRLWPVLGRNGSFFTGNILECVEAETLLLEMRNLFPVIFKAPSEKSPFDSAIRALCYCWILKIIRTSTVILVWDQKWTMKCVGPCASTNFFASFWHCIFNSKWFCIDRSFPSLSFSHVPHEAAFPT